MIKTLQEKEELKNYLEELIETLFMKKGSFENKFKNIPMPYSQIIKGELNQQKITMDNTDDMKNMLENLTEKLQTMQELNLTIAFTPSKSALESIYSWVKKNMGDNFFLNLEINPKILGGAIISYKGLYINNSLEKQLEKVSIEKILVNYL